MVTLLGTATQHEDFQIAVRGCEEFEGLGISTDFRFIEDAVLSSLIGCTAQAYLLLVPFRRLLVPLLRLCPKRQALLNVL